MARTYVGKGGAGVGVASFSGTVVSLLRASPLPRPTIPVSSLERWEPGALSFELWAFLDPYIAGSNANARTLCVQVRNTRSVRMRRPADVAVLKEC